MNRISTIPITLDPSIYRPRAPAPTRRETEKGQHKPYNTLAPAVYQPRASRTKDLPSPPPKSPWPVPERRQNETRHAREEVYRKYSYTTMPAKSRSAPPFYAESSTERNVISNPPPRKATMDLAPPRRPTIEGSSMERPRAPPHRPSEPAMGSNPSIQSQPRRPSEPTLNSSSRRRPSETIPDPTPSYHHSRRPNESILKSAPRPSEPTPKSSLSSLSSLTTLVTLLPPRSPAPPPQTRYITMLLSLTTIPRLHNILASLFPFLLLLGFLLFPVSPSQSLTRLSLSTTFLSIAYTGLVYLMLRWRRNYVWLLNRIYLPGGLNALAGLVGTLVNVNVRGEWGVWMRVAVGMEVGTVVLFGGFFGGYCFLLLGRVKREHRGEIDGEGGEKMGMVERWDKKPSFAPGSVV